MQACKPIDNRSQAGIVTGRRAVLMLALGALALYLVVPRTDWGDAWKLVRPRLRQAWAQVEALLPRGGEQGGVYVVQPGDSLSKIAARYGIPYRSLIATNKDAYPSLVSNPGLIQVGWELAIPPKEQAQALAQSVSLPTPTPTSVDAQAAAPTAVPTAEPAVKVLYIVGDIDGLDGAQTQATLEQAHYDAQRLSDLGLDVTLFEAGKEHWQDVLGKAPGAQVLIYRGHGVYAGDLHHPDAVGGFYLAPGEFFGKEQIANDLRVMAPGWVALLPSSCFAAGQSGPEWDQDIGLDEARRRVETYSEDFLAGGAACYFAGADPVKTVRALLRGATCGEATIEARSTDLKFEHPDYPGRALWLDRYGVNYTFAFVGDPEARPLMH